MNINLTRAKLEQICEPLYKRTVGPFEQALKDAGLNKGDIDDLVMVGGMTRAPKVIDTARDLCGKEPHKGVNPDEVVAIGAAIQGAILSGDSSVGDILLLDVTPLTLGIETAGGVSTPMIERNTTIPAKKSQTFSTYADNQTAVDVKVLQGERPMANGNKMLGNFRLDGIPPSMRGTPQIEVTFDIDANGILNVSAKDLGTGKDTHITITGASGLSDEEVENLRKDAEAHAAEDEAAKAKVEARNELDNLVYQTEKQLTELGDKLPEEKKTELQGLVDEGKKVLENHEASQDELKGAAEKITTLFQSVAQDLYANVGANAEGAEAGADAGTPPPSGQANDDNVVDADFEVVDEDKGEDK